MRSYLLEVKYEFLAALRTPRYSVSTVMFPAMFYIFFGIVMKQGHDDGNYTATSVMTAMSAMAVMLASLWGPGAGIAFERGLGWLEVKRASPMPPMAYFLAKISCALAFSTIAVAVIFILGGTLGGVRIATDRWLLLGMSLIAGAIPFSAAGFLIGYTATPNTAPAMINLIALPMSFLSGLWIPIQFLPKALRDFAAALPAYHLNQIATSVAGLPSRGSLVSHIEGLVAATLVLGGFAGLRGGAMTEKSSAEMVEERVRKYPFLPPNPEIGWVPYVWLIYVVWFALTPYLDHSPQWVQRMTIVESVVSLPLYFAGYWLKGSRRLWVVAALFLLATVAARWNVCASVFIVFGAAFIGHGCDTRVAIRWLAALFALTALESWIFGFSPSYWIPSLILSALVGAITINQAQRNRIHRSLKIAQQDVERMAKVAERERIARDLHDLLGHTLSLIVLKSELASKLTESDPDRAAREIRDVERISRDALAQVRAAVRGYRSTGLMAEVDHARATLETAGIHFECEMEKVSVPVAEESVLVLALREAVTNIVRHSAAQTCRVRFLRTTIGYELQVMDDGRGGIAEEGSGLSGMRERVESLGGTLDRDGTSGTQLVIRIPVESAGASGAA